ncbi:transcription termination factor NusA [Chloroflexota bacterium]
MKSDFLLAITQLSAEKNLPGEVVIAAVEAALVSAYRKDDFAADQNISVKINPTSGKVQVWTEKLVVKRPSNARLEISLDEARRIKPDAQIDEAVMVEATPRNAGRIAAQTAKQVILQRLHEAEHSAIIEEYGGREGDIVTGLVQRIESRQVFVDLGRTEAILPMAEQVSSERYRIGQRLKVVILEVVRTNRGPRVIVSRSHSDLPRRLFEMEVPEIFNGAVKLKAIAREAGSRSKVAVAALQDGIDPVGCCVGLRGIRIQNIVSELNGEKIDVVTWSPDAAAFITNALSPAQILSVELDKGGGVATVIVPDRQLSLAIGKEGQNVRLAAKLTGWRIDIKSASVAEAEKVEAAKSLAEAETEEAEEAVFGEEVPAEVSTAPEPALAVAEVGEPLPALDTTFIPSSPSLESPPAVEKPRLRFAEDVLAIGPTKPQAKSKKQKKKKVQGRDTDEDRSKMRKRSRELDTSSEDDEEEY